MRSDWRPGKLGDFIELKRGYDLPKKDRADGEIPVVSSSGISGTHSEHKVAAPGVVTGRCGTIGEVFFITENFWPLNTTLYVRDFKGNDPQFVAYFLKTFDFEKFSDKAAVPGINRNHLHAETVVFPGLSEQIGIRELLGTIDDKIANNRALAADLEAMARAIFKSWFVDFDPVKAKVAGRDPVGMDAETAALFPDELVESELGWIPKGWKAATIGKVARNVRVNAKPTDIHPDEPYVALEHLERQKLTLFSFGRGEEATSNKTRFEESDLLFGKLRPYFHKIAIAPFGGVCSTDVLAIRPIHQAWTSFVYCAYSTKSVVDHVTALSEGTRMPRTNWQQISNYPGVIPPETVAEAFNRLCAPVFQVVAGVGLDNIEFAKLRDTLLPRLISGKLRIPEAETLLKEAV